MICVLQSENASFYPPEFDYLIGKKFLMLVDANSASTSLSDGSYLVRRICLDPKIIARFNEIENVSDAVVDYIAKNSEVSSDDDSGDDQDDDEFVEDTQVAEFVDGLVDVPTDVLEGSSVGAKRNLAEDFEGVASPEKKRVLKDVKIEKE